ncbi:MAG: YcaO-like family protein [Nitrososphaeraceae archaeon]
MEPPSQPSQRMEVHSRIKYSLSAGSPSTRVKSLHDTLAEIGPTCVKIGVTRISDITHMDRLYIPNYSVVLPGTEDSIWVYNGKGTTRAHAKLSALMEAVERYSSLSSTHGRNFVQGSYSDLSKSYNKVLHPAEVVEPVYSDYNEEHSIMDFLPGFDLLNGEEVLVPAEIALYRYSPKSPSVSVFPYFHTNGLASGNVLEEAICHALCEVIERDAVSLADLCASCIQYNMLEKIIDSLKKAKTVLPIAINIEDRFVDDTSIFSDVDISEMARQFEPAKKLLERFSLSEIPLLIKNITQKDIGIPTFIASSIEWLSQDYGYFAKGYGTHPDSRIALTRAITEVSQTRAANIQGARDDLKKIRYKQNDELYKRKWQFVPTSLSLTQLYTHKKNSIDFNQIKSWVNNDILDDINLILCNLKKAGLKKVIIVDLTIPTIGIPVVRAIVPGLETFEVTNSIMGDRARNTFRDIYQI